jgi:hypothetical protein
MVYFYPFLLLSSDIQRNQTLATMFSGKMEEDLEKKKRLYETLKNVTESEILVVKMLYDLLYLSHYNNIILLDCFRVNTNKLTQGHIVDIDRRRLYERGRRLLVTLRQKCFETLNIFDDNEFSDLVLLESNWTLRIELSQRDWNNMIFNRISEIHSHIYNLIDFSERSILAHQNVTEIYLKFDLITQDIKVISEEIKSYLKLIDSF